MTFLGLFIAAYFLGGIPFGVLIARAKGIDIMSVGSGNIGATNVKRALGTKWGYVVFALDVLKSLAPTVAARFLITEPMGGFAPQLLWFTVGCGAIFGHCLSPFLKFKGGKGVSTALGAVIGAAPIVAVCCFGLFLVLLFTLRYMAIASVVGVSSSIVFGAVVPQQTMQLLPVYFILSAFVVYRHRANFSRLKSGEEPKFKL